MYFLLHQVNHASPPIAIVGNKKDIENDRMVPREKGKALADSLNALFFEVSGKYQNKVIKVGKVGSLNNIRLFNQKLVFISKIL